jgi:hypothetical protein
MAGDPESPTMKGEDMVFIQQNPDSLKSGDTLRDFDKLHKAMAAYLGNLKKWKANLPKDPGEQHGRAAPITHTAKLARDVAAAFASRDELHFHALAGS